MQIEVVCPMTFHPGFTSQQLVLDLWGPKCPSSDANTGWVGDHSNSPGGEDSPKVWWDPFYLHYKGSSLGWWVCVKFVEDAEYGEHLVGL